jgi:hypothetical protein
MRNILRIVPDLALEEIPNPVYGELLPFGGLCKAEARFRAFGAETGLRQRDSLRLEPRLNR